MNHVIHWFRRDLRLTDNTALSAAAHTGRPVIPVFILEDALRTGPDVGAARLAFLLQSAESLRQNLAALGCPLIIRRGRSEEILPRLCAETGTGTVHANQRSEPYARARDRRIEETLFRVGVEFKLFKDTVLWADTDILTQTGRPYTVFTPYSKAWKQRPIQPPRPKFKTSSPGPTIYSEPLPTDPADFGHPLTQTLPSAGERAALDTLRRFLSGPVHEYAARRDRPDLAGTSSLSHHVRAGTIGIRTILKELASARAAAPAGQGTGCEIFLNELIWREFYHQVLVNFPHVTRGAFRPEYDALPWSANREHFAAWCHGRTGYPIVDAAMRCLNATATMPNRLRMITAMFLTKDLLLNWQWGERYFMQQLVDGDQAANNGGWQWSAGTGTDAAPYFRIFNPVTQGEKCDPDGTFVRRWVPELAAFPAATIHQPWTNPRRLAQTSYPPRIILHEIQRSLCLTLFKSIRPA